MQKHMNSNTTGIDHIKSFWTPFLTYVKYIQENSKETDINEEIRNEIHNFTMFLTQFSAIRSNYFRIHAQKYFSKHPKELKDTYQQIIDNAKENPDYFADFNPGNYSYNPELFKTQFMQELVYEIRNLIKDPQKQTPKAELEIINSTIKPCETFVEKKFKQSYIYLLIQLGEYLKKFGLLEKYNDTFRRMLTPYSLQGLAYKTNEDEKNCISINTLFTENFLSNLSLPKLMALSAFWANRVAKDMEKLNTTLFMVNALNLWDYAKSQNKHFPIDDEKSIPMLKKVVEISKKELLIFEEMASLTNSSIVTPSPEEIDKLFTEKLDKAIEDSKEYHKARFDATLPDADNDLSDEIDKLHQITNTQFLLYKIKEISLFNLLMGCFEQHYSKNWGIVPDEDTDFAYIVMDIEGLNMPLRLHVRKNTLIKFLKEFTNNTILPLYKGYSDMEFNGQHISSTILAPLCKKHTMFITEKLSEQQKLPQYVVNYLKHIKFLKNSVPPPSLKIDNPSIPNSINVETNEMKYIAPKELYR